MVAGDDRGRRPAGRECFKRRRTDGLVQRAPDTPTLLFD
jgi:hypothetical protein